MSGEDYSTTRVTRLIRRLLEIVEVTFCAAHSSDFPLPPHSSQIQTIDPVDYQVNGNPDEYAANLIKQITPAFTVSTIAMTCVFSHDVM